MPLADSTSGGERDAAFMRHALALAERGWGQTSPNPMVGAVIVRDGEIVGEGWHARFGGAHAEVTALARAGERARGATVYVTLEPCSHHGKTPPCADALVAAGVRRVVAAVPDPHPVAAGGGARLAAAGITVVTGVEETAARELNAPFFHAFGSDRPWVTLKLALSLDGAIADHHQSCTWLTNARSRAFVHHIRAGHDAVAVGIGTVLADDPRLTVRAAPAPRIPPRRVVFDRQARLPVTSTLVRSVDAAPVVVVAERPDPARSRALEEAGVRILRASSPGEALRALRGEGVQSLLVEGGTGIAGAFIGATLVDRLIIFQAPVLLGAGALNVFAAVPPALAREARRLTIVDRRAFDDDLMTVYAFSRT